LLTLSLPHVCLSPLPQYPRELSDRTDDELCAHLRSVQKELSQTLLELNGTKEKLYGPLSRLTGHTEKMHQLLEAEAVLNRAYMQRGASSGGGSQAKKKTLSNMHSYHHNNQAADHAIERALQQWEHTIAHTGTRRQITSFVPDPVDLGGIPRFRLNEYPPKRDYLEVLRDGVEHPGPIPLDELGRPNWTHIVHPQHPHNPNYIAPPPPPPMPVFVPEGPQIVYGRGERTGSSYAAALAASEATAPMDYKTTWQPPAPASSASGRGSGSTAGRSSSNHAGTHAPSTKHHPQQQQRGGDPHYATTGSNGSYPQHSQSSGHQQQHVSSSHRQSSSSHGQQPHASYAHGGGSSSHGHGSSIGALPPLGGVNAYGLGGFDAGFDTNFAAPPSNNRRQAPSNSMSIGNLPPADPSFGASDFFGMDDYQ
jgi:hypothetical protein